MSEEKQEKKMTAKELSKKLTIEYLESARHARENGKFIGYTTAVSPVELFVAHDIIPIYPENHSVAAITKRLTTKLSQAMEKEGYTTHLCAYARSDLGYRITGESAMGGIPDPDFILACNAQCFTLTKWFEVLSRKYNIPVFVFDTPQWIRDEETRKRIIKYCVMQLKEQIKAQEEVTGKKFDYDRLAEVMEYSRDASHLYRQFLDLAAYKPSPISIFDALIHMAITVYLRGTPQAVHYYRYLIDEIMEEKVKKGKGAIENERFRLYWENLPVWFKFRNHFNLLAQYGGNILTSLYVHAWSYDFDTSKDPLLTLAENYVSVFSNVTLEERADMALDLFKRYDLNGSIMFLNRSCKAVSFSVHELRDMLTEKTGIPALVFESDMGDPRFYAEAQVKNRIQAYFETLEAREEAKELA
ncbi:MAG: 2-hydroxyacyl-CoA dehydratase [Deltaproteobacteria bacterium]|nr:2-hydroxyacyl-CoA dehydratase [Deltaproteobacteria bacterium]RLA88494.1 MAG: 2-hydroxyacyl-CoA dehydratase [Deltaproteobacteria bacterium]